MKIEIVIHNPHDPAKPTRLVCNDCETLDEAASAVWFFMQCCRVYSVSVEECVILRRCIKRDIISHYESQNGENIQNP